MASRASARTAAARNQASSPSRQSTESPVTRKMRTRSASVELGDDNAAPATKKGKRGARQASVESVGSNTSAASSDQGGRRKKATRGAITYPELSMVAEDEEIEQPEGDEEDEQEVEGSGHPPRSPGGMSQMSGTTAITSASAQTSHTTAELAELDATMVVEILPELWVSSLRILALTPSNATIESVASLVRELKVPGSTQAKRLMYREQKFILDREKFGSDAYIRPAFIMQKLFGSQEVESGLLRPDAILHTGNLATFIKDVLVNQKEGVNTYQFLSNLDTWFPESFVSQFGDNVLFGSSTLLEESFGMALEIRTQYTVVALLYQNAGEGDWDPAQVLTELFFDPLAQNSEELSLFEDTFQNGVVKKLMRAGPANTEHQESLIKERVIKIHDAFRESEDAAQAGDLVDWDQLEEQFPWSKFQAEAVRWTRLRQDEIAESVRLQGGVDNIVKSLIETIKNENSQAELNFEPHPSTTEPRQLLPSANIVPGTSGHSLMNKKNVRLLQTMKQIPSAPPPAQGQRKPAASSSSNRNPQLHRPGPSRTRATGPSEPTEESRQASEDYRPIEDDIDERSIPEMTARGSADYRPYWDAFVLDRNKENQLPRQEKGKTVKRFIDPQANARKLRWNSQVSQESQDSEENVAGPSKRKHAQVEPANDDDDDDDNVSQDEGFQADQRSPDLSRRVAATTGRRVSPARVRPPSPKRARVQEDEQAATATRMNRLREEAELQASARREASDEEEYEDVDELEEEQLRPSATQVAEMARTETARARQRTAFTQTRTAWSEEDTELLKDLIEELGCSWSAISKVGDFQVERGQVALKDKARNMKVAFLRSGVPLPLNFDKIALGQKEIRAVKNVRPDYTGDP